ncbi:50S ribosomal protein L23 [bacterium]|nr:50S ribosomal protein L23 [bacterium]
MKDVRQIIRRPLITEKTTLLTERDNKVVFEVDRSANKVDIQRAVERMFDVKVTGVRTLSMHGKVKRMGMHLGRRPDWKKAIVTLRQGDKIEFFEGT